MAFRPTIAAALATPAFLITACTTVPLQSSNERISVSRGLWYASWCVSTCFGPDTVTVSSNGDVVDEFAGQVQRSRITAAELAKFRIALAPYRQGTHWPPPVSCWQHTGGKYLAPYSFRGRVTELEITWSDRKGAARVIACDTPENAALSSAVSQALKLVHLGY